MIPATGSPGAPPTLPPDVPHHDIRVAPGRMPRGFDAAGCTMNVREKAAAQ